MPTLPAAAFCTSAPHPPFPLLPTRAFPIAPFPVTCFPYCTASYRVVSYRIFTYISRCHPIIPLPHRAITNIVPLPIAPLPYRAITRVCDPTTLDSAPPYRLPRGAHLPRLPCPVTIVPRTPSPLVSPTIMHVPPADPSRYLVHHLIIERPTSIGCARQVHTDCRRSIAAPLPRLPVHVGWTARTHTPYSPYSNSCTIRSCSPLYHVLHVDLCIPYRPVNT